MQWDMAQFYATTILTLLSDPEEPRFFIEKKPKHEKLT
jgi:hypothetical protein